MLARIPTGLSSLPGELIQRASALASSQKWPYELVGSKSTTESSATDADIKQLPRWRRSRHGRVIATVGMLILAFSAIRSTRWSSEKSVQMQQNHYFRMLVPSPHPNVEICRTLATAAVLGYPSPDVLTWDGELNTAEQGSKQQRKRIELMSEYLHSLQQHHDEDLVLLLDGPIGLFQLRPEVMLDRYYRMNEKANKRLSETMGPAVLNATGIRQSIVISSSSQCVADAMGGDLCSVDPYDQILSGKDGRQRFSDVGYIIGPHVALRRLFDRAEAIARKANGAVSLSGVMQEIVNQQDYRRGRLFHEHLSLLTKFWRRIWGQLARGSVNGGGPVGGWVTSLSSGEAYEFGVGFDHDHQLGLPFNLDKDEADLVQFRSTGARGASTVRLPTDIAQSTPPFWTPSGQDTPFSGGWKDVQLLAAKRTGEIPALITFKDTSTSSPEFQDIAWSNMWMHGAVRSMYEAQLMVPKQPMASVVDGNSTEHVFWNAETRRDRDGIQIWHGEFARWGTLCAGVLDDS